MYQYQVSFSDAIRRALTVNYCNFSGRASRSEFWWFQLFLFIIGCILNIITLSGGQGLYYTMSAISGIWSLAILLPQLGLQVRRFHDTGRSAWNLLWWFLPVVGWIVAIVFLAQDSQYQTNQYGPVPNMTN